MPEVKRASLIELMLPSGGITKAVSGLFSKGLSFFKSLPSKAKYALGFGGSGFLAGTWFGVKKGYVVTAGVVVVAIWFLYKRK